jgi:hypothetical protein
MYIKKQRLPAPGRAPLNPPVPHAMMAPDIHGRRGERRAGIAGACGLDANVICMPFGQVVEPRRVAEALAKEPAVKGVYPGVAAVQGIYAHAAAKPQPVAA